MQAPATIAPILPEKGTKRLPLPFHDKFIYSGASIEL